MARSSGVGRIAAIVALGAAVVLLAMMLFGGGDGYKVTAHSTNASQLVPGNLVEAAGVRAGTIDEISLGDNGTAELELSIDEDYAPLPEGTVATIRSQSLSGIANRYIQLSFPEGDQSDGTIPDGGVLTLTDTVSEVDLDQLFNTFTPETVGDFKNVIKGFARSYDGIGPQTNRGFKYFNPFLSTSREVFGELTRDERAFERLIIDTASLSGALAERADDLEGFIANTDVAFGALAAESQSLTRAVEELPGFMRNFNTTAVNLRAALDDVEPLVDASKPAARALRPFSAELRGFATDAAPAVRDLDGIVSRPGKLNDLIELTRLNVPLARIAVGPVRRNGKLRRGALPESADSLIDGLPQLSFFRPYIAQEAITGWFDDFGHSGTFDANGGMGRISTTFNTFILSAPGVPNLFAAPFSPAETAGLLSINNLRRCPGSNERDPGDGSTPFTDNGNLSCDPTQTPPGP